MKKIKIALLGFGTVGTGVAKLLKENHELITQRLGAEVEIAKILVRGTAKERYGGVSGEIFTTEVEDILNDEGISIIVEVMGGKFPAKNYVLEAFRKGKQVVSANKEMISDSMEELGEEAYRYGCRFLFEASVGGAIPVLRTVRHSLTGDRIEKICGILNGTTNYILTKMKEEDMAFEEALEKAKILGYAEADATDDITGIDAGRKMAILSSLAFQRKISADKVYIEGIDKLTRKDMEIAERMGKSIKLLASAEYGAEMEVSVAPRMISKAHLLSGVKDSFNAVMFRGNGFGDTLLYGRGAGELPTASAVLSDIIEVGKSLLRQDKVGREYFFMGEAKFRDLSEVEVEAVLRMKKHGASPSSKEVEAVLVEKGVSILERMGDEEEWIYRISSTRKEVDNAVKELLIKNKIEGFVNMIEIWTD